VFLVLAHDRRRILHFNVTAHPTAEWTGQQLREAFAFDKLPRYLLRRRRYLPGTSARHGYPGVLCTPRSPWQRAYVERVIGSIRRECLDHVLVFHETSLRRILRSYLDLLSPIENASLIREGLARTEIDPAGANGESRGVPQVGGLHQRYERRAAA
jgi:hypothetical protein